MQPAQQSAPIAPSAVHPAGTGETPAMPPNLTSVPYPNPTRRRSAAAIRRSPSPRSQHYRTTQPPTAAGRWSEMDHALVKRLRQEVGDRVADQRRLDQLSGLPPMTPQDERQFARAIIGQVLSEHAHTEMTAGRRPPNAEEEEALAAGIHAALFGVGRLQPLLDDPEIENIDVNGCDRVFVSVRGRQGG